MKWIVVLSALIVCAPGSYVYKDGCEIDIQPEIAKPVQPSDERPPSDRMPSYQRSDVMVVDAPNMADEDAKADAEKVNADRIGKKSAGIRKR